MKIVTIISDENNHGLQMLKLSCIVNNLNLVVVVSAEKNFTSRRLKDDLLKDYLKDKDDDEIILFTDGYDAVFMCSEEEILEKFYKTKKDILFSAETNCWPDPKMAAMHPDVETSPYCYLNSGGFIGKVGVIKELLEDYSFDTKKFSESNQYIWMHRFFKHPDKIGLDTACEIFCTFSPEIGGEYFKGEQGDTPRAIYNYYIFKREWFRKYFDIENGRIYNKITNTWPAQAHFNGDSKLIMDNRVVSMLFSKLPGVEKIEIQ